MYRPCTIFFYLYKFGKSITILGKFRRFSGLALQRQVFKVRFFESSDESGVHYLGMHTQAVWLRKHYFARRPSLREHHLRVKRYPFEVGILRRFPRMVESTQGHIYT